MASINGISAKGITKFLGHEGEDVYQGNLYLGNRKIGFWSQDSWGGEDRISLDPKCSERKLNDKVKALNADKTIQCGTPENSWVLEYDLGMLLHDFIILWLDEKEFKKAVKAGFGGIMVATDGFHVITWKLPESYTKMPDEGLMLVMHEKIKKAKSAFFKEDAITKHVVKVYRALDDFNIGEPIKLEDIANRIAVQ